MAPPQRKPQKSLSPMKTLVGRVTDHVRRHQLLQEGDHILVAVSGGSDSLALLHLLDAISIDLHLTAAYIDHCLRPQESPEEQRLIAHYCAKLGIPLVTMAVDVPRLLAEKSRSPEEAARLLRYQALEDLRQQHQASLIAVGHTADDQVEGFFLRLLRGAGAKGFSGMSPRRGVIIRPLLEESKATLIEYLQKRQLSWCTDSSNSGRQFLRNRIRLELLPYIEREFSPGLRATVRRTMELIGCEENFLATLTEKAFAECCATELDDALSPKLLTLELAACHRQHPALLRRIIEACFWKLGARPSFAQIDLVRQFLEGGTTGGVLHLHGGLRAELGDGKLHFFRLPTPVKGRVIAHTPAIFLTIPGPGRYLLPSIARELHLERVSLVENQLPSGLALDADLITFPLQLRPARPGERFHPCHGNGSKKVNRFLNERKIPASDRLAWPVLAEGDHILALPGLELGHDYRVSERTRNLLLINWLVLPSGDDLTKRAGNGR